MDLADQDMGTLNYKILFNVKENKYRRIITQEAELYKRLQRLLNNMKTFQNLTVYIQVSTTAGSCSNRGKCSFTYDFAKFSKSGSVSTLSRSSGEQGTPPWRHN